MTTAIIAADGRVTISADVCKAMSVGAGDRVTFMQIEPGQFLLVAANRSVTEMKGMFGKPVNTVSIEEMESALRFRGAASRCPGWLTRIANVKLVCSVYRNGCSPDNAAYEGLFGQLKTEVFFARDWLSKSIEEFVVALDTCIRWHSEVQIKSSLGSCSSAQYSRRLGSVA